MDDGWSNQTQSSAISKLNQAITKWTCCCGQQCHNLIRYAACVAEQKQFLHSQLQMRLHCETLSMANLAAPTKLLQPLAEEQHCLTSKCPMHRPKHHTLTWTKLNSHCPQTTASPKHVLSGTATIHKCQPSETALIHIPGLATEDMATEDCNGITPQ